MTLNIWKSYMWIAASKINMKAIFAVMHASSSGNKAWDIEACTGKPQFTYMIFIYSKSLIHHYMGLLMTDSQSAC